MLSIDSILPARERELVDKIIDLALIEDLGLGDISSQVLHLENKISTAEVTAKQEGIISGLDIAQRIVAKVDPSIKVETFFANGEKVKKGDLLLRLCGNTASLLALERTMLNFLQRMSGIATETYKYTSLLTGTKTKILDTRKTAPGLRILDKRAVEDGGGQNHRMDLYSMVMFKDNHLKAMESTTKTLPQWIDSAHRELPISMKIEVETTNLDEVKIALEGGADIIMLDNMSIEEMTKAMTLINGKCQVEVSGNVTLERLPLLANLGVDFISVGALTHSVKAFDITMKFL